MLLRQGALRLCHMLHTLFAHPLRTSPVVVIITALKIQFRHRKACLSSTALPCVHGRSLCVGAEAAQCHLGLLYHRWAGVDQRWRTWLSLLQESLKQGAGAHTCAGAPADLPPGLAHCGDRRCTCAAAAGSAERRAGAGCCHADGNCRDGRLHVGLIDIVFPHATQPASTCAILPGLLTQVDGLMSSDVGCPCSVPKIFCSLALKAEFDACQITFGGNALFKTLLLPRDLLSGNSARLCRTTGSCSGAAPDLHDSLIRRCATSEDGREGGGRSVADLWGLTSPVMFETPATGNGTPTVRAPDCC